MAIESPRPDHWERVSCTRAADGFHAAPKRFKVVPRPAFATAEYLAMAVKIFNEKAEKATCATVQIRRRTWTFR